MKKNAFIFSIIICFVLIPFPLIAETNEIKILLYEYNKYFNERKFDYFLNVIKKMTSNNIEITSQLIVTESRELFSKYNKMNTNIYAQGKNFDNTNYLSFTSKLTNDLSKTSQSDQTSESSLDGSLIYDNNNKIIEFAASVASYELKKVVKELKNSTNVKVYFNKNNQWFYQYDLDSKDIEILTSGLQSSNEYWDYNSSSPFNIKLEFILQSKTFNMFLGEEHQYYIEEIPGRESIYPVKGNKIFSELILKYSIYENKYLNSIFLEPEYLIKLSHETQEIVCKIKMDILKNNFTCETHLSYCPISLNDRYLFNITTTTREVICPKHGKLIFEH